MTVGRPTRRSLSRSRASGFVLVVAASIVASTVAVADEPAASAPVVRFDGETRVAASEGHVTLAWAPSGLAEASAPVFELEQSLYPDFGQSSVRYRGPQRSFFIAGLREGETYFRVRADGGAWSETLTVAVVYPSRTQVVVLMTIGGIVLVMTVATVIHGAMRYRALPGQDVRPDERG